jgi:hypothetical protein
MTSAYEIAADALKLMIDAEFAPEGIVTQHDNLHESLGFQGPVAGISPARDLVNRNNLIQETSLEVKLYNTWVKLVDPTQAVDPRIITNYAERFRRGLQSIVVPSTGIDVMWYFNLVQIEYPNDPTGNKSRFVATVRAWGNNSALVETAA